MRKCHPAAPRVNATITVLDGDRSIDFSFEDMLDYHGPGSPGGVAHAFKVLERALPLLSTDGPPQRREIAVRTAFGGPGARDAFELITRAVTGERYELDPALGDPGRGRTRERFVFCLSYRGRQVTLGLREGYVSEEFIDLARADGRSEAEERRLSDLKLDMAERVMAAPAAEIYDASIDSGPA